MVSRTTSHSVYGDIYIVSHAIRNVEIVGVRTYGIGRIKLISFGYGRQLLGSSCLVWKSV